VRVVLGDTDRGDGFGSAGSRSLFTGGSSLHLGAEKTLETGAPAGGPGAGSSPPTWTTPAAASAVKGTDVGIDLFELAGKQPEQRIFTDHTSAVAGPSWPNGCHVSEVEIDPATGEVQVVRIPA
jgi:carbon-monoxide dehydrogenase large subunit